MLVVTMSCYACDGANPDRIVVDEGGRMTARIPVRFVGPPGNANGGIAAGALACAALRRARHHGIEHPVATRVTARLHRGVPVGTPLTVDVSRDAASYAVSFAHRDTALISGAVEVASAARAPQPGDVLADPPDEHRDVLRDLASVRVPDVPPFYEQTGDHPIPGCFSCGPANDRGMKIIPRLVDDGLIASVWRPDEAFDDGGGVLAANIIASALDCSSGICMPLKEQQDLLARDEFFLLGSLDVQTHRLAPVDAQYRVVGRALHRDGRKFYGLSALYDDAGALYTTAQAIWIVAPIKRAEAFGPK